ncbi:dinuclear metal center YbgI/SA1388 family protein [Acetoanaerobium pronyense]|uniref:GTP cyclohydrolase 1 type 2 homolog n=1 Tax=Acetoanaerobium pronyense TaxID=1482736 RepID=A0ABS4KF33_9FIRM|nr:Nif3-like dinuclear metal center hexameric protein [Acetoanaerobium pronyense]MBP2026382.1 dinuclear metal center YbgI/SA1388 family protein [Acetoanaerobium pronyense]
MLLSEIVKILDEALKIEIAYEWDNVGLLVGDKEKNIKKIMLTLEITKETIDEAKKNSIDLIISHHPLIFKALKTITTDHEKSKYIIDAIKNDIAIYSSHTNFDMLSGGLNDYVADLLELEDTTALVYETSQEFGIGRIGKLKTKMDINEFSKYVIKKLNLSDVKIVRGSDKNIEKVGVVNGAGIEYWKEAKALGCDIYITGDVKYHEAQDIKEAGMSIIDAGHFGTEKHFNVAMKNFLRNILSKDIEIYNSTSMEDPFLAIQA